MLAAIATMASSALPPSANMRRPASAAARCGAATTPRRYPEACRGMMRRSVIPARGHLASHAPDADEDLHGGRMRALDRHRGLDQIAAAKSGASPVGRKYNEGSREPASSPSHHLGPRAHGTERGNPDRRGGLRGGIRGRLGARRTVPFGRDRRLRVAVDLLSDRARHHGELHSCRAQGRGLHGITARPIQGSFGGGAALGLERAPMTERIRDFLNRRREGGPCLVVDLDVVRENYLGFARVLPDTRVFYAVKANPSPEILKLLAELGSSFDVASVSETEAVLAAGATPDRISYGNTIKKVSEIAAVAKLGVTLFAVDCEAEVEKVARAAPGARVICRIHCDGSGSEWPLSRKFGREPEYAPDILELAHRLDLVPHCISFHLGSQP